MTTSQLIFLVVGSAFCLFYGLRAVWIFMYPTPEKPPEEHTRSWWVHQIWINFVGSAIGWGCIYILYSSLAPLGCSGIAHGITGVHVLLSLVGVLGIMGFIPYTLWNLASALKYGVDLLTKGVQSTTKQ